MRAASMAGVNSDGRDHEHARSVMVPTMSRWPPVGGHPAMVVAIVVQLGRAQERSAWEGGVKGARLLFRRCLVALFSLLLASLSIAGFVSLGRGRGWGYGWWVRVHGIGHGVVWVG